MFRINTTDPSLNSYYYPILLLIFVVFILIELLILAIKNHIDLNIDKNNNNTLFSNVSYSITFIKNKNSLKIRYLICYIFARAAMWAKAPYLYTLFATVHKFSMGEISNLYLIDAVAAFIFGPITGQLADIYGRRFFCHIYNLSIILNLLLRMAGTKPLAYASQIITGLGAGLINTTFEAWVVAEAKKDFGQYELERDKFLKKLFRTANIIDAAMSKWFGGTDKPASNGEALDAVIGNAAFGASRKADIQATRADGVEGDTDSVGTRGTGGADRVGLACNAEGDRDVCASFVRN